MSRFRRTQYVFVTLESFEPRESRLGAPGAVLVLTSILSGAHLLIEAADLEKLRGISVDHWVDQEGLKNQGLSVEKIEEWTRLGILLSDCPKDLAFSSFRDVDERLSTSYWPPCAALFHLLNHHQESLNVPFGKVKVMFLEEHEAESRALQFLASHGPPPQVFFEHPARQRVSRLPLEEPNTALSDLLFARRTCRTFEASTAVSVDQISRLLRLTFGPVASRTLAGIQLLLKTSPSGGALHPVEGFPLIFRCQELGPGLYHYQGQDHSLALLSDFSEEDARRLAIFMAQGQDFVGACAMVVVLVARFDRNFWKYRERENSYSVVLQDAGHLSQTFQLIATEMNLGVFYTAAINSSAISSLLQLKYPAEAPIGLLGVGVKSSAVQEASEPFIPRSS